MKHILIADDDRLTSSLYARALQSKGNAIHFAYDVMQAVMAVTRSKVDAVILDMHMPGGTGLDVIHRMKASNRLGPIPIIVISGSSDAATIARAKEMGADAYFAKPVDMKRLQEAVNHILAGEPMEQSWSAEVPATEAVPDTPVEIPFLPVEVSAVPPAVVSRSSADPNSNPAPVTTPSAPPCSTVSPSVPQSVAVQTPATADLSAEAMPLFSIDPITDTALPALFQDELCCYGD